MIGTPHRTDFPYTLFIYLLFTFAREPPADISIQKTQISKIIYSGGFFGSLFRRLLGPLMKAALPLSKNVLIPLGMTGAVLSIDAKIQRTFLFPEQQS